MVPLGFQLQQRVLRFRKDREGFEQQAKELEELRATLVDVSLTLKPKIMLPLGKHAMIEGHLQHTNEVCAWFCEQ